MKRPILIMLMICVQALTALAQLPILRIDQPEIDGTTVKFNLHAPEAKEVKLFSDFIPGTDIFGLGGNVLMEKGPDGTWTYTAENLKPEFYFYFYVVDGVKTLDPWNISVVHNYKEHLNTFLIKGETSRYYEVAGSQKGILVQPWYPSSVLGHEKRVSIYLPYGYDGKKKYDVLYLQHGGGDDEETWLTMGRLCQIMDHMIAEGKCEPMIVVMPNCWDNLLASFNVMPPLASERTYGEWPPTANPGGKYVEDLVTCLIPYVEANFRVKKGSGHRALSGLSAGGQYTLNVMKNHPELFDYICIMGSGIRDKSKAHDILTPFKEDGYRLFWTGCSEKDLTWDEFRTMIECVEAEGMEYTYFDPQSGHNWSTWRKNLMDFLPRLFK